MYRAVHQLIVDAYAVQLPKSDTQDQMQQVALCLMTLGLFVEDGVDVRLGPQLHGRHGRQLAATSAARSAAH